MPAVTDPLAAAGVLRPPAESGPDAVVETFLEWAARRGLTLYPHQEQALLEVVTDANVVVATPTGSGKSLIATAAAFAALSRGTGCPPALAEDGPAVASADQGATGPHRVYYTAPIKALVSEKFFEMTDIFGPAVVGMITGDASVNPTAPIICCTAEILAGVALRGGAEADPGLVVMDEFHYYGDRQRGWAWQVPLLELPRAQFVLLSATLGDMRALADDLRRRTGRPTTVVDGVERPVPLHFSYSLVPLPELLEELRGTGRAPIYLVHFTQAAAVERAQALASVPVATRAERDAIADLIGDFRFSAGFGRTLSGLVRKGIGVHHAGMLPKYRRLVEKLAQSGLLKVICGTDTLGVGINVPIRTVLLTALAKYDGHRSRLLSAREFHQIAGRAGRAGFDVAGDVVVMAPEHVIENERALAKAGDDPAKRRKVVRRKAPEGAVGWTEQTFDRLVAAAPEPLSSHFRVTHAMVLAVLARPGDAFTAMRRLIESSHDPRPRQLRHALRAIAILRALLAAGVVRRLDEPDPAARRYVLVDDLNLDFSLDQPLSPLALAALDLLDRTAPTYPLDVVSLFEATLEGPGPVLHAQRHHARGEAVAALKAQGIEYEERMALLEEVDHPRPLADEIDFAYEQYRRGHPWVSDYRPEPKSIVRDLFERAMTFTEYVGFYGLARSEGLVLRYLADAYRALRRSVPPDARTPELEEIVDWLGEVVRGVDSSLLEEWEALAHPDADGPAAVRPPTAARGITGNERGFTVMVRNAVFRRVELLAREAYADLGALDGDAGWKAERWREALAPYWQEYDDLGISAAARSAGLLRIDREPGVWTVRQTFDDPAGDHDWGLTVQVDLAASDEAGEPVLAVADLGPTAAFA